jgi:molecular chaperone IbpA
MTTFDFSPLYRSAIGFDRLFSLMDSANRETAPSYPPYNVELLGDNKYMITMAVAGFSESELDIELKENTLTIAGRKQEEKTTSKYLYQGIAARNFERKFQLADYIEVKEASFENGLLNIVLERILPEAMKPRKISIAGSANPQLTKESKVA